MWHNASVRTVIGWILGLAFVAALVYATLAETGVECEVCVEFNGRSACRTGTASDRTGAVRGAISNACKVLSSGVTQSIACDQTRPQSVVCE
jgi:hypothetical protein